MEWLKPDFTYLYLRAERYLTQKGIYSVLYPFYTMNKMNIFNHHLPLLRHLHLFHLQTRHCHHHPSQHW
jgi:hypothetical protein